MDKSVRIAAESMNSVVKESIGTRYSDQATVHEIVYNTVIKPQERELIKAIYEHGEYRLHPTFKHFEVNPLKWQQKENHITKVLKSKQDTEETRPILKKIQRS